MTNTNNNHNKSWRTITLMFVMALLPIVLAILFYFNPQWIKHYKNYGALITPPIELQKTDLTALGAFSEQHFDELDERWLLIHVIPEHATDCDAVCRKSVFHSHQLWLMLNQNLMRLRRVMVFSDAETGSRIQSTINDPYLLYAVGRQSFLTRLATLHSAPIAAGTVVLRDPLGNVMLWYNPDFDPYKVKKDLSRLFRTSRVG